MYDVILIDVSDRIEFDFTQDLSLYNLSRNAYMLTFTGELVSVPSSL